MPRRRDLFIGASLATLALMLSAQGPVGSPEVATMAALKSLAAGQFKYVATFGHNTIGDEGGANYYWSGTNCSLNSGAGDDGSQIKPNAGTGCWLVDWNGGPARAATWGLVSNADNTVFIGHIQDYTNATGGDIVWPRGLFQTANHIVLFPANGAKWHGQGAVPYNSNTDTIIQFTGTTGDDLQISASAGVTIEGIKFNPSKHKTSGCAINITGGAYRTIIRNVVANWGYNDFCITQGTWTRLEEVYSNNPFGSAHIYTSGSGGSIASDGIIIERPTTGTAFTTAEPNYTTVITYPTGVATAVTLGKFTNVGGYIWEATTGGTTAGGAGPVYPTSCNGGTAQCPFTTDVVDGTVHWQLRFDNRLAGWQVDSQTLYGEVRHADFLNGMYGIRITNTLATVQAEHISILSSLMNHQFSHNVSIEAGENIYIGSHSDPSASAIGNNVHIVAAAPGAYPTGVQIIGNEMQDAAHEAILLDANAGGAHVIIKDNVITSASISGAGTYDNIQIGANAGYVTIVGNSLGSLSNHSSTVRDGVRVGAGTTNCTWGMNQLYGAVTGTRYNDLSGTCTALNQ